MVHVLSGPASHRVELGDDEHTHRLVERRAHAQTLLVGAPVQAGDRLRGQGDVLQEAERAGHAPCHTLTVLLAPLSWILTKWNIFK